MDENEKYLDNDDNDEEIAGESKADKFKRLAQKRTNNAIKQISGIGKLSSSSYEYTEEQVEKIFGALQNALDEAKSKYNKGKKETEEFQL